MKKIGLVGEDPNDTTAVQNLLQKRFSSQLQFKQLIKNKRGHQLDNERTHVSLKIEFEDYNPHAVIFVRDTDGILPQQDKIQKVNLWFTKMNKAVNGKGYLLANIYELEALILADIETFNSLYKTDIKFTGDVSFQKEPKEFLMKKTEKNPKRYMESHCPAIFKELKFDIVMKNCKYFSAFVKTLQTKVKLY